MPTESFLERAGLAGDDALRGRAEAFLKARGIGRRVLAMLPDELIRRYARYLSLGWPTDYADLMNAPVDSRSESVRGRALLQAAAVLPCGAAAQSMAADFERQRLYYDEERPVYADVCQSSLRRMMSEEVRARLIDILQDPHLWRLPAVYAGEAVPDADRLTALAVRTDEGIMRRTASGVGAPADLTKAINALFEAIRRN